MFGSAVSRSLSLSKGAGNGGAEPQNRALRQAQGAVLRFCQQLLKWFRQHSKQDYLKCFDLVRAIATDPRNGIGKPERLKHFDKEVYSRRVNHKDRIIYTVYETEKVVDISSCKGHYE